VVRHVNHHSSDERAVVRRAALTSSPAKTADSSLHRRRPATKITAAVARLDAALQRRARVEKKANGTELSERLERLRRLVDELERVQGEQQRINEIAQRIRREVEAAHRSARPYQRDKAADGGSRHRRKK
jgi:hypothetical protein